jgi:hypothetical protein
LKWRLADSATHAYNCRCKRRHGTLHSIQIGRSVCPQPRSSELIQQRGSSSSSVRGETQAIVRGETGREYRLLSPLVGQAARHNPNVWRAVHANDEEKQYVVKCPSHHDDASLNWPLFSYEVQTQRRFFQSPPLIRKTLDSVPSSTSTPPIMVLEVLEETLWDALNTRSMTRDEIRWIMKGILLDI